MQGYHPSLVLVSKQVLLALSPLHHQVLPPPATAHLLPSSFLPAIRKALMQQLFDAPVLDGFEHEGCSLQLWHVWWHSGCGCMRHSISRQPTANICRSSSSSRQLLPRRARLAGAAAAANPAAGASVTKAASQATTTAAAAAL